MSVRDYLEICFKIIVEGSKHELSSLTTIRLCTSHITKNMKSDVSKHFKKNNFFNVCGIIGLTFDLKSFGEIDELLKDFLLLLMTKKNNSNIVEIKGKISKIMHGESYSTQNNLDVHQIKEEFENFDTIYKHSKFFQIYDNFIRDIKENPDQNVENNTLYNPTFAGIFLKKYVSFIPFWSSLLTTLRCEGQERANNGLIEGKLTHNHV